MKSVFIVTHQRGFECDPIIDTLHSRGIPVFRFNCETGNETSLVTVQIGGIGDIVSMNFSCDDRIIADKDIGIGWFQQIPPFIGQPQDKDQTLQNENLNAAYLGAVTLLNIPWMNPPEGVLRASNKILQLAAAARVGLRVPETIVTNQPTEIRTLCAKGETIVKNLATPWLISGEEADAAYTALVESEWLTSDDELRYCPAIYQRFSRRAYDYRVVVVGNRAFAAKCKPQEHQQVDIRRGSSTGHGYVPCSLKETQITALKELMARFSLSYCSADFMEDGNGNLYFLDLNSCGAWWWVDDLYAGEIRNAICDHILSLLQAG